MRISTSIIIAGAAFIGLAGLAPTLAREHQTHTVTVRVPGGGVETIEYTGEIAPTISFEHIPVFGPVADPFVAFTPMGITSCSALDRISAEMDRQMDMMMHQAQMLAGLAQNQPLYSGVLTGAPEGATFSMVSESSSNGACSRLTRITQSAGDAKPRVVSQTSGNCGLDRHGAMPAALDIKQIDYSAQPARPLHNTL
jgi:hypothetical protein